jgi:hypothetical protein
MDDTSDADATIVPNIVSGNALFKLLLTYQAAVPQVY